MTPVARFRTIFVSDLHLGASDSRARDLADFLKAAPCDTLFLVGDIIDMWCLKKRWRWPDDNNRVVRRILKAAQKGTRVIYIPGNHDEAARKYAGLTFGGVEIALRAVHVAADGRRLLVTHGDEFDLVVKHAPLLSAVGGLAYDWLLRINRRYNAVRLRLGMDYWSLAKYLKSTVKSACTFISKYEDTVIAAAQRARVDGVVCGHIHQPQARSGDVAYYNCGDWVEGTTAIVEHADGTIKLIDAMEIVRAYRAAKAAEEGARTAPAVHDPDEEEPWTPHQAELLPLVR